MTRPIIYADKPKEWSDMLNCGNDMLTLGGFDEELENIVKMYGYMFSEVRFKVTGHDPMLRVDNFPKLSALIKELEMKIDPVNEQRFVVWFARYPRNDDDRGIITIIPAVGGEKPTISIRQANVKKRVSEQNQPCTIC